LTPLRRRTYIVANRVHAAFDVVVLTPPCEADYRG
jgi:hypothetical protein